MRSFVSTLFVLVALNYALACKKVPLKTLNHGRRQNGDNGYRLVIGNDVESEGYEPGKIYNCMSFLIMCVMWWVRVDKWISVIFSLLCFSLFVTFTHFYIVFLVGSRNYLQLQQFTHFMITAETFNAQTNRSSIAGPKRVGRFQLFGDALTKFYEDCVNTVAEADDFPKTEVQVSSKTSQRRRLKLLLVVWGRRGADWQVRWKLERVSRSILVVVVVIMDRKETRA